MTVKAVSVVAGRIKSACRRGGDDFVEPVAVDIGTDNFHGVGKSFGIVVESRRSAIKHENRQKRVVMFGGRGRAYEKQRTVVRGFGSHKKCQFALFAIAVKIAFSCTEKLEIAV